MHACSGCCTRCWDEVFVSAMPHTRATPCLRACVCAQVLRVFHDRLISAEDKALLQGKITELVQRR